MRKYKIRKQVFSQVKKLVVEPKTKDNKNILRSQDNLVSSKEMIAKFIDEDEEILKK